MEINMNEAIFKNLIILALETSDRLEIYNLGKHRTWKFTARLLLSQNELFLFILLAVHPSGGWSIDEKSDHA